MHRRKRALTALTALTVAVPALVGCGGGSASIGQPAEKAKAKRVIEVRQSDASSFEPKLIVVKPSETVTLQITNTGKRVHEFFLGDDDDQKDHQKEMSGAAAPMNMPDRSNALSIEPGATEELTWTFPKRGTITFGCHQPGDYAKGMKGEVKVSE